MEPDDIDAHHAFEPCRAHLVDARLGVDDAGIVDESIEPAPGAVHRLEDGQDIGLAADVTLDRKSVTAGGLDVTDQRVGGSLVRGIVDCQAIACLRPEPADGGADAATAAGDQQHSLRLVHSWHPFSVKTSDGTFENPLPP